MTFLRFLLTRQSSELALAIFYLSCALALLYPITQHTHQGIRFLSLCLSLLMLNWFGRAIFDMYDEYKIEKEDHEA